MSSRITEFKWNQVNIIYSVEFQAKSCTKTTRWCRLCNLILGSVSHWPATTPHHEPLAASFQYFDSCRWRRTKSSDTCNSPRINQERKKKGEKIPYLGLLIVPGMGKGTRCDVYLVYLVHLAFTMDSELSSVPVSYPFYRHLISSVTWFPVSFGVTDVAWPYNPLLHLKDENLVAVMSSLLHLNSPLFQSSSFRVDFRSPANWEASCMASVNEECAKSRVQSKRGFAHCEAVLGVRQ